MSDCDRPAPACGHVLRWKVITRDLVRANKDKLFVFGDNMQRTGYGGQAGEMRDEPNAIGVPTKWRPTRDPHAYFKDDAMDDPVVFSAICRSFEVITSSMLRGVDVVIPADGLGTGLAQLPVRAPRIHAMISGRIAALEVLPAAVRAASRPPGPPMSAQARAIHIREAMSAAMGWPFYESQPGAAPTLCERVVKRLEEELGQRGLAILPAPPGR